MNPFAMGELALAYPAHFNNPAIHPFMYDDDAFSELNILPFASTVPAIVLPGHASQAETDPKSRFTQIAPEEHPSAEFSSGTEQVAPARKEQSVSLSQSFPNSRRRRTIKSRFEKGPNMYGRSGTLRCQQCRRWRQQVPFTLKPDSCLTRSACLAIPNCHVHSVVRKD
jgi:hypothetical protein